MSVNAFAHDFFFSTNRLRIISLLAKFYDTEFHEREIARKIGVSYGSANKILNELHTAGVLVRHQKGKMLFYSFNPHDPALTQLKILLNIELLRPLVARMKELSSRIVLYGSCARGEDISQSDVDLYVITEHTEKAARIIRAFRFARGFEHIEIEPVILSPLEMLKSEKNDPEFQSLVREGIVLWDSAAHETGIQEVPG